MSGFFTLSQQQQLQQQQQDDQDWLRSHSIAGAHLHTAQQTTGTAVAAAAAVTSGAPYKLNGSRYRINSVSQSAPSSPLQRGSIAPGLPPPGQMASCEAHHGAAAQVAAPHALQAQPPVLAPVVVPPAVGNGVVVSGGSPTYAAAGAHNAAQCCTMPQTAHSTSALNKLQH